MGKKSNKFAKNINFRLIISFFDRSPSPPLVENESQLGKSKKNPKIFLDIDFYCGTIMVDRNVQIHRTYPNRNLTNMLQVAPGFARLLATENIGVAVNPAAPTAMFDVKSRTLTMPNWDCSERLRDMLIGHECAHAIYTDATDMDELLKEVFGYVTPVGKDYLNVIEDVRIDKLIQRKYAGLRRDYRAGYAEMRDRDFFNLEGRDPNALKFIDRINLHFKGFEGDVQFSGEEMVFVNRAANTETFQEVCDLAREIFDWCMENEGSEEIEINEGVPMPGMGDDDGEGDISQDIEIPDAIDSDEDGPTGGMNVSGGDGGEESGEGDAKGEGTMDSAEDAEDDGSTAESASATANGGDQTGDEIGDTDTDKSEATGKGFTKVHVPAPASTQRAMDENVAGEANVEENDYYNSVGNFDLPLMKDINLDNIIIGHKEVLACKKNDGTEFAGNPMKWDDFQKGAKATVTNLAQMFERKKAAAVNARTQVAKTGRLDMTALHKYKMTEDIFLRNKVEIKGKNHGIVMYVDWSGSMDDCMSETVAQTAITAMFCKKVGIPFRVYAFSTHTKGDRYNPETNEKCWGPSANQNNWQMPEDERNERSMSLNEFSLIEIFSDKMKKADWDRMGSYLMCIGDWDLSYDYPGMLHLGGTPLNESIVAAMKVASEFRKANGVDVLNSIWITDGGDGDPFRSRRCMVQQKDTGRTWSFDQDKTATGTNALYRIYKDLAGGNLIGIFLDSKKSIERNLYYANDHKNTEKILADFKKDGFIEQEHKGYDTYFLMDKKIAVYTSSDKMDALPEDASTTRVINAFRKDLGKRTMSRPLLNTFTDKIAKEIV